MERRINESCQRSDSISNTFQDDLAGEEIRRSQPSQSDQTRNVSCLWDEQLSRPQRHWRKEAVCKQRRVNPFAGRPAQCEKILVLRRPPRASPSDTRSPKFTRQLPKTQKEFDIIKLEAWPQVARPHLRQVTVWLSEIDQENTMWGLHDTGSVLWSTRVNKIAEGR